MKENRESRELKEKELMEISGGTGNESTAGSEIVERAVKELGKPYQWGAAGPDAYDCSGLVSYCLTGVHRMAGTTTTFMGWNRVSNPQPGDVCTSATHCGIYVGGGRMIHAPSFGSVVSYASIQGDMIIVRP